MVRWVIVTEGGDGINVFGPGGNRTYVSSEAARRDADAIESDYEQVHVLPLQAHPGR